MSPTERRNAILNYLNHKRFETAPNLAMLFGVSERTIRSDIVALSCSYPIQMIRGRYRGGIQIADWFHQHRSSLSPRQEALLRKLMLTLEGEDLIIMNSILAQFALSTEYE